MDKKIITHALKEDAKEFYGATNDSCPICGRKFIAPTNVVKLGNVIYDLECYYNNTKQSIDIR